VASFAVKFLGCKVSQADAMLARSALLAAGHAETAEDEAELQVINTCCITSEAEAKSRQAVRRALKRPGTQRVLAAGCAINLSAPRFAEIDPRVSPLVGTADDVAAGIAGWAADLDGLACADTEHDTLARERARSRPRSPGGPAAAQSSRPRSPGGPAAAQSSRPRSPGGPAAAQSSRPRSPGGPAASQRTRGFVKVQDGCDCHCAYCIIPTVRGPARSRPAGAILEEVAQRVAQGQPEMVMTGISVGDYRDPERGLELGELMREVARVPGVRRVRLSSVEVIHVRDSLLEALAEEPRVCPHLHVPLQSGDDGVLAAMGRHYTAAEYLANIERVRAATGQRRELNITTDVIVGFPGEDDAAFARTLETIDAAGITRLHVFPYSPRPGTVAAGLGDEVGPEEKKRRGAVLRGRSELRSRLQRTARLGRPEQVLIDKVADTVCSGYTADYVRCYLPVDPADPPRRGQLVDVICRELQADGIRCTRV
jgi:threonylcarbamoyladenosine tRNA methylthiotransferase MtaB